jgi:hypothetical protein
MHLDQLKTPQSLHSTSESHLHACAGNKVNMRAGPAQASGLPAPSSDARPPITPVALWRQRHRAKGWDFVQAHGSGCLPCRHMLVVA